jgi:16S rRNA (guanine1207-N2)-methyltransferase
MDEHYFTKKPKSKKRPRLISLYLNGRILEFMTSSGVFSKKKVDNATVLLIENMRLNGGRILDLGCGYGPIGIAAAVLSPGSQVVMAEYNQRAVGLAKDNVKINKIPNAQVVESDFFGNLEGKFDAILINPPMAIGLQKLFDVVEECKDYLKKGGSLQFVSRHNKGGARLGAKMREVFGNVEETAKSGGFRVYLSVA